jgi:hypothetical protein
MKNQRRRSQSRETCRSFRTDTRCTNGHDPAWATDKKKHETLSVAVYPAKDGWRQRRIRPAVTSVLGPLAFAEQSQLLPSTGMERAALGRFTNSLLSTLDEQQRRSSRIALQSGAVRSTAEPSGKSRNSRHALPTTLCGR